MAQDEQGGDVTTHSYPAVIERFVRFSSLMVACVGAPSSLAVQVAKDFDITLVGFLRENHFNIYHGAAHILGRSSD